MLFLMHYNCRISFLNKEKTLSSKEVKLFFDNSHTPQVAIFLSGSGTNAIKILEHWQNNQTTFNPACLVTERPLSSNAREIAKKYQIPLVEHPLKAFYTKNGAANTSLATEEGRHIRREWTAALVEMLSPYNIDFGIFAGFIPLCNITDQFPCLNVHPGDLTVEENGERVLVGLHTIPVREAIIRGHENLASTVIVATAYSSAGKGMDEGIILSLSPEVDVDWQDRDTESTIDSLKSNTYTQDPTLMTWLDDNQEKLKVGGDWEVFPKTVEAFAKGKFAYDDNEQLYAKIGMKFVPIKHIAYNNNETEVIF